MANANRPSGLSPVQYLDGSPWNGQARMYHIPSTDLNAYAIGDPVDLAGGADVNGVPIVTLATPGSGVLGAIVSAGGTGGLQGFSGPFADPSNLNTSVIPATKTKDYYVLVADDPSILFEVQEVSGGTQLTVADVGLNANLVAGANSGFVSGWQLTNSTEAATGTLDVRIERLAPRRDNAVGAYAKWWVKINNHRLGQQAAGVA